jgi:excisionase family DNA binding protein
VSELKENRHATARSSERRVYTMVEVARILGIGRNQVYRAAEEGVFPTFKIGKSLRAPAAPVDRLAATGSITGTE